MEGDTLHGARFSGESGLRLRGVEAGDGEFLFQVFASTRRPELAVLGWNEQQTEAFLRGQFHAQQTHYANAFPHARSQIVLEGAQPIGRLCLDDSRPEEIHLIDIALLPSVCGRGLGTALMRGLIEQAQSSGRPLRLHVEHNNPARRLYRRLGFCERREEGIHLLMEWNPTLPAAN
jgi:ribosomal protein S18 acetylase RimI-like enzyme